MRNVSMTLLPTKTELAMWFVDHISDCGRNNFYGYYLSDDDTYGKIIKDYTKDELANLIFDYSDEGQKYITN